MRRELKDAFELILQQPISDEDGKAYYHYYWDEYFPEFIVNFLNKESIEKNPDGIIEPPKGAFNISMYQRQLIDFRNSFILLDDEFDYFAEFSDEVVDAVVRGAIFIGECAYIKGSTFMEIIKEFNIDMKASRYFHCMMIVARVYTDGSLYSALCSLFCTSYGYENIMGINHSIRNLHKEWIHIFEEIGEPLRSHLACFFQNEQTARAEGACYSYGIKNGRAFEEFTYDKNNKCLIQLEYGENQASSFILECNKGSLLSK